MSPVKSTDQLNFKSFSDPQASTPSGSDNDPPSPSFIIRPRASLGYLEHALGYSLAPVRRGIECILKSERGAASPLGYEPSILDTFAFTLAAAPQLLAEASEKLLAVVKHHRAGRSSFTVTDLRRRVVIRVVGNVIEDVRPIDERPTSKRRG